MSEACSFACELNNVEILKLLLMHGANPNATYQKNTAKTTTMHYAASHKNVLLMKLLIKYGFDCKKLINSIEYAGNCYSVFLMLCHNGSTKCMEYLINACQLKHVKIDTQHRDMRGRNGLYIAVNQENVSMVSYLLDNIYNDPNIKTSILSNHVSDIAAQSTTQDGLSILKLLIKHKCPINKEKNNGKSVIIDTAASRSSLIFDFMLKKQLYPDLNYLTTKVMRMIFLNGSRLVIPENICLIVKHLVTQEMDNDSYKQYVINVLYRIMMNGTFDGYFDFIKHLICIFVKANNWKHFLQSKLIDRHVVKQLSNKLNDTDPSWYQLLSKMNGSFDDNNLLNEYDDDAKYNESKMNESDEICCNKNHLLIKYQNSQTALNEKCTLCEEKSVRIDCYQCVECNECICNDCYNTVAKLNAMLKKRQFEQFEETTDKYDKESKLLKLVE